MKRLLFSLILLGSTAGVYAQDPAAQAAQAQANEQRLRDTLRATTQRLQTSEAERATALAGQTERDEKIAALEVQVATLTKNSNEDQARAEQSITGLKTSLLHQERETTRLATTLDKWKKAYQQAAITARNAEAARSKLNAANIELERKLTDRETQNLSLYQTGSEILERFANYSLGRAIVSREPFTGIAKAKLEEQIQDYADKLQDQKLRPVPSDGKPSTQPVPVSPPRTEPTPATHSGSDGRRKP